MKTTTRKYVIADVFTKNPLEGNPVAVFTDAAGMDATLMQRIAKELNLSETTFVFPPQQKGDYYVRIFTPVNELPFAGHPTLGTAIVLGLNSNADQIHLETGMGLIPFSFERSVTQEIVSASMKQPVPTWKQYEYSEKLLKGLGLSSSTLPIEIYHNGPRHVFIGLPSIEALSAIKPNLNILAELQDVAVNCFAGIGNEWRMRMFSPAYGVSEDAATGSAAGPLALHLARYQKIQFGDWITIHQGVEMGKYAVMRAKVISEMTQITSIYVAGSAVVVAEGKFHFGNTRKKKRNVN